MGSDLKQKLMQAADLSEEVFNSEFANLAKKYGFDEKTLTLDQLRDILSFEIQDVLLDMKRSS